MKFIYLLVALTVGLAFTTAESAPKNTDVRTEISTPQLRALAVAIKHLEMREDYSAEQRKLENYEVWIEPEKDAINVSFLAVARKGDEEMKGGNYSYARSTTYVVSPTTFQILKVWGSK